MSTPVRSRRRSLLWIVGSVAAFVALYATVVALYAGSGDVVGSGGEEPSGDTVVLSLTPEKMDATTNRLAVSVVPTQGEGGTVTDGLQALRPFGVLVSAVAGSKATKYDDGDLISPIDVSLVMDGQIERWPFDRYTVRSVMTAIEDDADGESTPLSTVVQPSKRGIPGWDIAVVETPLGQGINAVDVTVSRSGSTIAFGIVLLSLMVVIPALVLVVAIIVLRGRRKVEVTVMGWMGAMLFATIPLRNFLPGSPPIGSWIDYLIVLWVLAALVAGLVIFVVAWVRRGPA
ncbi:DUF4436 family protein [Microbacterium sp. RURRCA19A]|uniref:DUF4436 family protein n=1 Tax=Microbacterium sp. RURRCA19A TaxID=1907391 RepID=UPI000953C039|nr:DUF4436 family protein [Microbacterium sp. RURRCA19A]SIS09467.1 protein of unknown function [Microbacterium sp. RURRCA19A]